MIFGMLSQNLSEGKLLQVDGCLKLKEMFKEKSNNNAPLVAKGFSQTLGQDYEEIFAPVVLHDSLWLLLVI